MSCGWNSKFLCHHCFVEKSSYLETPSKLQDRPRRDANTFKDVLRRGPDGNYSPQDARVASIDLFLPPRYLYCHFLPLLDL